MTPAGAPHPTMKNTLLVLCLAVAMMAIGSANPISAGDAPPFLQVGKSYTIVLATEHQFKVLEIGKEGWIKVVMQERNQTAWINTNAVPIIAPYPFEGVQNPP
jgi:hypothetical protein